jgi:prepilin-type N-terminal cleavage/methylation domain-containing protein
MRRKPLGFTLVELMVVVVIIGILAGLALPKLSATKERAYITMMQNDLRNLGVSQEAYMIDAHTYYDGPLPTAGFVYNPSTGVSITITEATATGWSASATSARTTKQCAIFFGDAAAPAPATVEGRVACN